MMKKSFALSIALHVSVIAAVLFWMLHHKEPIKPKVVPVTIITVSQPQKPQPPQPKELPEPIQKPIIKPVAKPVETPKPTQQVTPKPLQKPQEQPIVKKQEVVKEQPKVEQKIEQKVVQKTVPQTPTVDTKKVKNAYFAYVHQSAERLKIYPHNAKRLHQEGEVIVHFVILADGTITDVSLQTSSGFGLLDEAAVKIITTLAKLKPIPKELNQDKYDITLPIDYILE